MRKFLFFAFALAASVLAFTSCNKEDKNEPETPASINKEYFEGYWHLDSMANAGSRPLDVTLINDTLLSIDALEFKEPAKYKWSHKDGVINAPWIWSAPIQYVNYSVVSVDNAKAVLKKETDGMLLYFTHILEVPEGE